MTTTIARGVLIPFLGTSPGAAMVFLLQQQIASGLQKILTGFAAGIEELSEIPRYQANESADS